MPSETFPAYRHSGKYLPHGPALVLAAVLVAGFPLGFAYGYLMKWIPFILLRVFGTAGYGMLFGFLTLYLLKFGKVRNTLVAVLCGIVAGMGGLYFAWNGHIHTLYDNAPLLAPPGEMLKVVELLYENGSWSLKGSGNVTGVVLGIVWLVEALIIIGISALIPAGVIMDTPFCETNQCWLDEEKKMNTLDAFTDPEQLAAFKRGDLSPLLQARPRPADAQSFARLILKQSSRSEVFCTVRLENVITKTDGRGNPSESTTPLTGNLVLPPSMRELLQKFETFSETGSQAADASTSKAA